MCEGVGADQLLKAQRVMWQPRMGCHVAVCVWGIAGVWGVLAGAGSSC